MKAVQGQYIRIQDQVLALAKQGDMQSSILLMNNELNAQGDDLGRELVNLLNINIKEAQEAADESDATVQESIN